MRGISRVYGRARTRCGLFADLGRVTAQGRRIDDGSDPHHHEQTPITLKRSILGRLTAGAGSLTVSW